MSTERRIILASTSPRRQELLRQIGVTFDVFPSHVDEAFDKSLSPTEIVEGLAARKARVVAEAHPNGMVIAADTVVAHGGKILGKPRDPEDAVSALLRLSGQTHEVITGVALKCLSESVDETIHVSTEVSFGFFTREVAEEYVATREPLDKAGAYAIQGIGAMLVRSIRGSYSNVVGLPLYEVTELLRKYSAW